MNGTYYPNPTFPGNTNNYNTNIVKEDTNMEQSYIENILRHNKGKMVNAYVSFPDSNEWRDKVFSGRIEQAGRDHLIISDVETGKYYLILMIYLNYVEFDERILYTEVYKKAL